jgi:hypothetical protein
MVLEVEAVELIAEYFEDVELRQTVEADHVDDSADTPGPLSRFKSWLSE